MHGNIVVRGRGKTEPREAEGDWPEIEIDGGLRGISGQGPLARAGAWLSVCHNDRVGMREEEGLEGKRVR